MRGLVKSRKSFASFTSPTTITAEVWVKPNDQPVVWRWIVGKESSFAIGYTNNQLVGYIKDGTNGGTDGNGWNRIGYSGVQVGNWYHVVLTYNNKAQSLSVNGVITSGSFSPVGDSDGNVDTGSGNFKIGDLGTRGKYANGTIDEVRIYNYARTADQIAADYRAGAYRTIIGTSVPSSWWTNGLVGYWNFDGPNTTTTSGA